jgi:hypothetical protein
MQHVAFGQLLVCGIFVETVIALISKKKPVCAAQYTHFGGHWTFEALK